MTSLLQQHKRTILFRCLFLILAEFSVLNGENIHDCRTTVNDLHYNGKTNITRNGHNCAFWKNEQYYSTEEKNYCRTPAGDHDNDGGPWCYIDVSGTVWWERCNVPVCNGAECPALTDQNLETLDRKTRYQYGESVVVSCKSGYKITGNKYLTCLVSGHWNESIPLCVDVNECLSNLCQNGGKCTDGINGYTCTCLDDYYGKNCENKVSLENIYGVTCFNKYDKGLTYTGIVNSTAIGEPCMSWKKTNSPYATYYPDHNYCRNPRTDTFNQPWCYTGLNYATGKCNVPVCDCRNSTTDLKYNGFINVTRNGNKCLRWSNAQVYTREPDNYCRTPENDRNNARGPWCFVKNGWNSCNVPVCGGEECPKITVDNIETLDRKSKYQYGESAILTCKPGYRLIGQKYLTCLLSGQWNDTVPRCEAKKIAPKILLTKRITIDEGTLQFYLPCFAEGLPMPVIEWGSIDKTSMPANVKQVSHFLMFEQVSMDTNGLYMCMAKNEIGTDIQVVHVIIKAKPPKLHIAPVIRALSTVTVNYYTDAKLVCNITGFPTPSVSWKYKNNVLNEHGNILVVKNVTNTTAGYYTCIASNDVGTNQVKMLLEVTYDTPTIVISPKTAVIMVGQSHNFTCIASGHPKPSIKWSFKSFADESITMPSNQIHNNGPVITLVALKTLESGTLTCTALNEFGDEKISVAVIFRNPRMSGFG